MKNPSGYEEAAQWFFRCAAPNCTAEELKAFEAWLEASPRHVIALMHVQDAWNEAGRMAKVQQAG
jgi:ferric-dicitrate binding protein FerR (iron transport regulator)